MAYTLRQNVAPWDRVLRALAAIVLVAGSPILVRGPYWLTVIGAVGGVQMFTALSGY